MTISRMLVIFLAVAAVLAAQSGGPIGRARFMKAVEIGGIQADDFVPLIESLGVDFKLSAEDKKLLAGRGVHTRILEAIDSNWRARESVAEATPARAAAPVSEETAAAATSASAGPRRGGAPSVEVEEIVAGGPAGLRTTGATNTPQASPGLVKGKAVVVIVHKDNPISNIDASLLRRIYTGEQTTWKNGRNIYVINRAPTGPERRVFYRQILKSDPAKTFYLPGLSMTFRPHQQEPGPTVRGFVSRVADAIAYVDSSEVDQSVKVLAVNGVFPTEEALAKRTYPLIIE